MRTLLNRSTLTLALVLAATGCASQQPPSTAPSDPTPPATAVDVPDGARSAEEAPPAGVWNDNPRGGDLLDLTNLPYSEALQTIYFDYDQAEIRPDQRAKLQANAQYLRENSRLRVVIAGHADERGTREYNMALGERRASNTMQYLVALGVARDQIEIISYGEEQPAVRGKSESVWNRNRRAEFLAVQR